MGNIKSFPNNRDEYIGAEYAMRWLHGRTSGVFAADNNAAVAAVQGSMAVTVSDGLGWLTDSDGNGIVWWNDAEKSAGAKLQLTVDAADGVLNRIDRVIVEWQTTDYADLPEIKILKGTASSTAAVPALTNNGTKRQISLAQISVAAGTTAITASMITDERLDPAVCGLVTESVAIDTTTMQAQFEALLSAIQEELAQIEGGSAYELKKLSFSSTKVAAASFVADSTYTDFPYRAPVALMGVTSSMTPEVVFGVADAMSGIFAPVAETYNGGVYIYAAEVPNAAITIPTILCWR
nr:MAG TPA: Receptor Binding Protein [Caudoviricetes sp.]